MKTSILILLCIFGFWAFYYSFLKPNFAKKTYTNSTAKKIKLNRSISILILGADSLKPGNLKGLEGRSDFMLLVYINPKTNRVSILSLPRDTRIYDEHFNFERINIANKIGGYQLSKSLVEKLLGIKIDHVVLLSIDSVAQILNYLGPFKIYVPKSMHYQDQSAGLNIEIDVGLQSMNGSTLIKYFRYRNKDQGDIGRIKRQQVFFRAALKKLKEKDTLIRLPSALLMANKAFSTDLDFQTMFKLIKTMRSLNYSNFQIYILPGDFGKDGSWIPNQPALAKLIKSITKL